MLLFWFNISWQLSTTQSCGMGERIERVKAKNLELRSRQFNRESRSHASQAKQGIHSPLPMGSYLHESRAPLCVMVMWVNKHHHSECPLLPLHSAIWSAMSLWSVGSAVPAVSTPISLSTFSLLASHVRSRNVLGSVQTLLSNSCPTSLNYQRCFQHQPQTQPDTSYSEENSL